MARKGLITIVAVVALLAGAACVTQTPAKPPLENTTWVLGSYGEQGNLQPVIEGVKVTAEFDSTEGRVTGSAGCNSYFADYEAKDTDLSISALFWTERGCVGPEGVMEQEQKYLAALGAAESYEIKDDQLRVFYADGGVLVFAVQQTTE